MKLFKEIANIVFIRRITVAQAIDKNSKFEIQSSISSKFEIQSQNIFIDSTENCIYLADMVQSKYKLSENNQFFQQTQKTKTLRECLLANLFTSIFNQQFNLIVCKINKSTMTQNRSNRS